MPTGFAPGFAPGRALGLVPGVDAMFAGVLNIFSVGRVYTSGRVRPDETTGKTGSLVCHVSGVLASQATAAQQCALPAADAAMGGALALTFAGAQWYDSADPASYWKPLHDGTGCTWYTVFKPTVSTVHVLHSSRLFVTAAEIGHTAYINNLTNFFSLVSNGAAESLSLSGGVPGVGTATYLSQKFATASTPDGDLRVRSASVSSGNAGALSSADPVAALRLGAGIAPSNRLPLQATWGAFLYVPRVITVAEDAFVQNYLRAAYGIAP